MKSEADYISCEIRILNRTQVSMRAAERDYSDPVDLNPELEQRLLAASDSIQYGKILFGALLPPDSDLRTGYRNAQAIAQRERRLLRVHLFVEPTAPAGLQQLRWERLYDEKKGIALACSREVVLSRDPGLSAPPLGLLKDKPRLLVAIANPTDLDKYRLPFIDLATSRKAVEEALAPLEGKIYWEFLSAPVTLERLSDRLIQGKFHALHLQAHGQLLPEWTHAKVALEKPGGATDFVDEKFFGTVFNGNRDLRLVTMVACHGGMQSTEDPFSGLGPAILKEGIPAVLAMRQRIRVETAKSFVEHFYRNLARSGWVDRAVNEARHQLLLSIRDSDEWSTPILFLRQQEGLLWKPEQVSVSRSPGKAIRWPDLLTGIEADNLVPLLGPDVPNGVLLSGEEIAAHWIAGYDGYPLDRRTDLPAVADFVAIKEGKLFPHRQLPKLLIEDLLERQNVAQRKLLQNLRLSEVIERISQAHFDSDADEPHRILAELPISTYLTTNYDSFMTEALRWNRRKPKRQSCYWREDLKDIPSDYHDLAGSISEPLVFHVYGSDVEPGSLVLTEDNHLDFLRIISREREQRIPTLLSAKLTKSMLLFLGYDIRRLDCRVLLRGIISELRDLGGGRYAVLQVDPDENAPRAEELRFYIEECFRGVKTEVYWGSVPSFLGELRDRWAERQ